MPSWAVWVYFAGGTIVGYCVFRMRSQRKMTQIKIEATPVEAIPVDLVGKPYELTPPKTALTMKLAVEAKQAQVAAGGDEDPSAVIHLLDEWLDKGFGTAQANKIRKRLNDPGDLLDVPHIMALIQAVMERQTGNPTS